MTVRKVIIPPTKAEMTYATSAVLTDNDTYASVSSTTLRVYIDYKIPPGRTIKSLKIYFKAKSPSSAITLDEHVITTTKSTYSVDFFSTTRKRTDIITTFLNSSFNKLYFGISTPSSSYSIYVYYVWAEVEYEEPYGDISLEQLTLLEKTQKTIQANLKTSYVYAFYSSSGASGLSYNELESTLQTLANNNININDVYSIYLTINYNYNCNHGGCYSNGSSFYQYYGSDKFMNSGSFDKYTTSVNLYMHHNLSSVYYKFYYTSGSYVDSATINSAYYTIVTMTPPPTVTSKIYLGANNIQKMYLGSTEIKKAYLGTNNIFSKS